MSEFIETDNCDNFEKTEILDNGKDYSKPAYQPPQPAVMDETFIELVTIVYEKVLRFSVQNPDYPDLAILDQLRRSVSSIGCNYCEGFGYFGRKQCNRFLRMSRGSAFEARFTMTLIPELHKYVHALEKICTHDVYKKLMYEW